MLVTNLAGSRVIGLDGNPKVYKFKDMLKWY